MCSTVQHRTQSILQARHLLTEFSHCVHLPLSASIRRAATFPESILVPEASFWRQQQYVSTRTSLLRPSPQPFKLYIESCLALLVIESLRNLRGVQPVFVASAPLPQALIERPRP